MQPRRASSRKQLRIAIAAVLAVWSVGTFGYMLTEGWSFAQAFYFTLITITTVGYGDYGVSEAGRTFTLFILIGGIAVATFAVGQIVQTVVDYRLDWESKMNRTIESLTDHFIICGFGRIGAAVCEALWDENVPFAIITNSQEQVERAVALGYLATNGDATEDHILEGAGLKNARGIAALTSSDAENIVITLSAREISADAFILARVEHEDSIRKIQRAGASRVISPIRSGGENIAESLLRPHLTQFLCEAQRAGSDIKLAEVKIASKSILDGAIMADYGAARPELVIVAVVTPDGTRHLRPKSTSAFRAGDTLIIAGDSRTVASMHLDAGDQRVLAA